MLTAMKQPLISILIVSYKTPQLLRQTIRSIQQHLTLPFEVIVTDNASGDETTAMLRREFSWVKLIASDKNLGFAAGNNRAFELATGDLVFFLNPDTQLTPGSVERMVEELLADENTGMVAPRLHYPDGSLQRSVRNDYSFWGSLLDNRLFPSLVTRHSGNGNVAFWDHSSTRTVDWAKGAALLAKRAVLEKSGLFDERFWIYGEEMDLCMRIRKAGFAIRFVHDAVVIHHEKQSTRQNAGAMFVQNYRSHYLLLQKHYSRADLVLYFTRSLAVITVWMSAFAAKALAGNDAARASLRTYKELLFWHLSLKPLTETRHA
jgi:prepilin-type processing-associated H-X9-DG protein